MDVSAKKITGISVILFFSALMIFSFIISPDIGEKILYGKHPPVKDQPKEKPILEYSEIITSGNYDCMESASLKAHGDLSDFVKEFNKCNKS
jgi:hypothetical protein